MTRDEAEWELRLSRGRKESIRLARSAARLERLRLELESDPSERNVLHYAEAEEGYRVQGGYAADAEVRRIAAGLGLGSERVDQPLKVLSGGERRRVEMARILFGAAKKSGAALEPGSEGTEVIDEIGCDPTDIVSVRGHGIGPLRHREADVHHRQHRPREVVDAIEPDRLRLAPGA